jgi:hypothetical protein
VRRLRTLLRRVLVTAAIVSLAPGALAQRGDEMARARALDQQGAKAYQEGRYNDAIRYFGEAYRLGGPPFELWNVAKCYLRLDQPEQAAETLERYLALANLPPDDRAEASRQLDELKRRPSTLTIASTPSGATIAIDGKTLAAKTPASTSVGAGAHTVTLTAPDHAVYTKQVEAKYGRAIILDAPLVRSGARSSSPPANPYVDGAGGAGGAAGDGQAGGGAGDGAAGAEAPYVPDAARRFAARGDVGVVLPRYGSIGGSAEPGLVLSGTYRLFDKGPPFAIGGLFFLTGDDWKNSVKAPTSVNGCGSSLSGSLGATAMSFYAIATVGWDVVPRLRVHGVGGLGAAGYITEDVGGDVFVPSCTTSPGVRPSLLLGAQVDYHLTEAFRLTALPLVVQLQPAFAGVRTTPLDASGLWMRATLGIGVGVDL